MAATNIPFDGNNSGNKGRSNAANGGAVIHRIWSANRALSQAEMNDVILRGIRHADLRESHCLQTHEAN